MKTFRLFFYFFFCAGAKVSIKGKTCETKSGEASSAKTDDASISRKNLTAGQLKESPTRVVALKVIS
jgi:hypothetical protein